MQYEMHFLYPGGLFFAREPHLVTTILGSCVAVCLWDPTTNIGGINHFMLPLWNGQGLASPRYGNIAIDKLIDKLEIMGASSLCLKAKVFGGAEVIANSSNQFKIGERNSQIARSMLSERNIPIIGSSIGGFFGRKIIFNTFTGEVMQRYVGKQN